MIIDEALLLSSHNIGFPGEIRKYESLVKENMYTDSLHPRTNPLLQYIYCVILDKQDVQINIFSSPVPIRLLGELILLACIIRPSIHYPSTFLNDFSIREMELKFPRNAHNISLYKNYVFYYHSWCAFIAMATWSFHRLIMGKVKEGLFFYLLGDSLIKHIQKCYLVISM